MLLFFPLVVSWLFVFQFVSESDSVLQKKMGFVCCFGHLWSKPLVVARCDWFMVMQHGTSGSCSITSILQNKRMLLYDYLILISMVLCLVLHMWWSIQLTCLNKDDQQLVEFMVVYFVIRWLPLWTSKLLCTHFRCL